MIIIFIFKIKSEIDTQHFDHFDEEDPWIYEEPKKKQRKVKTFKTIFKK